ncbi:WhiB family transcriptional regulator [Kocuria sp. CPCC 205300]|uniref:WhiB family transcriptional regulator n=1 Tax=Kocuria sabuli TaxID=3071448 RepID=UPI0036DADBFF
MIDQDAQSRRPKAHAPAVLDAEQALALNRLTAVLAEHLDGGEPIPCNGSDALDWISDQRAAQDRAATACHTCPALDACARYVLDHPEPAGVYGGMTTDDRRAARAA